MSLQATRHMRPVSRAVLCGLRGYSKRSAFREDEDDISVHQKLEQGKKPRIIHGEEYPDWRRAWGDRPGEFFSMLKAFKTNQDPRPDILAAMNRIPDITWKDTKEWWSQMKEYAEVVDQRYINQRVETLGVNLAAAHFFLWREASIRWRETSTWLKGYPDMSKPESHHFQLPTYYEDGYFIEGIDASTFHNGGLRYSGLENLHGLSFLKWFSLKNNTHIDEWCLDRVAGTVGENLEYLDISGCPLNRGMIVALSRMSALRVLVITDPGDNVPIEAALAELEEVRPQLIIKYEPPEAVQV